MEIIKEIEKKIKLLEKENCYLKSLLLEARIPFETSSQLDTYIQNQGELIISKTEFTDKEANVFFSTFSGRTYI